MQLLCCSLGSVLDGFDACGCEVPCCAPGL